MDLPWQQVREWVQMKLYEHEGELCVLAKSEGRQAKEKAIRRKRLARLLRKLRVMRQSLPNRDQLLLRIGAAKKEAGRAFGFVAIRVPKADEEVTRQTFTFATNKQKLGQAEQRDGHYLLRSNLTGEDPAVLWERYIQFTHIEAAFKQTKAKHCGADPEQDGVPGPWTSAPGSARLESRAPVSIRWQSALHPLRGHRADMFLQLFWESTSVYGPGFPELELE